MFDIYGCYFRYGDFGSIDYDLVFANIDTSRLLAMETGKSVNTIRTKKNQKHYVTSVVYDDEPITFEAEIVTSDGSPLRYHDTFIIERELFTKTSYTKLRPERFYDADQVYINCILTNPERIEIDGGIVGYKFVINADSAMAWEEDTSITVENISSTHTETITVDSDLSDYIYPTVSITTGNTGGDVVIYNSTDDSTRFTSFENLPASTSFTMYGDINHLTNDIYQYFTDRNFIRLLNGENSLFISGDVASITITFNNRKFL